jgi:hypothetical protein
VLRRSLFPLFVVSLLVAAGVSQADRSGDAPAARAADAPGPVAAHAAASSSPTAKAAKAAAAFKASLSASERTALQYAFDSSKKTTGWSNLPTSLVARNGVKVGDLTSAQRAKLAALLRTVLSTRGYTQEEATRKADTYLNTAQSSGGSTTVPAPGPGGAAPGGGMTLAYGEGLYYVAFYGTPSTSHQWTVQFGGHHLAIHMTFSGAAVSNTPYFVGVEPKAGFTVDGKTYQPMRAKAAAMFGAAQSLTTAQEAKAKLSGSFDDVVVGPGHDGKFPKKQGVTVSTLSAAQQKLVTKAVTAYVADEPTAQAVKKVALYKSEYSATKLSYSGTPDGKTQGGYVRIQGPRLWLEIATQPGVVLSATHYHSIERDIKSDYGAGT